MSEEYTLLHHHPERHEMEVVERIEGVPIFRCTEEDCEEEVMLGVVTDDNEEKEE